MKLINTALFKPANVAIIVAISLVAHAVAKPLYSAMETTKAGTE